MSASRTAAPVTASRALWGVARFLWRRPVGVGLSVGLLVLNISIELAQPQFLGRAINALGDPGAAPFSLAAMVAVFLGLVVTRTVVGLGLGPLRNRTVQETLGDLRAAVYDALQRQTFSWQDNARTGELISRASTDVGRLQEFLFACLLFVVDVTAGLVGTLLMLFLISPFLAALSLAAMVPTVLAMIFFARQLQPRWRRVHERHSAMTTVLQENIAGVRVVRAFAREPAEVVRFRGRRDEFLQELLGVVGFWAARVPLVQFIFGLGVPLVLWFGGRQVIRGELPLGDLAKAVLYLLALGGRLGVIGTLTGILQNAGSAAQRVFEILEAPVDLKPGRLPLPGSPGAPAAVRLENVSFQYRRGPSLRVEAEDPAKQRPPVEGTATPAAARPSAIEDITLEVAAGETLALVGATGAGKSTLLSLVPRFHDPTSGRVLVEGVDVRELDLAQLRRSIGVVFQETFLFSASVAENIAFGRPDASREEIERVARAARAHEFITALAQGYDTVIGERGVSLSGGQRQRLAIARALLVNPRIILLDDATSAVDPATEREIREAIQELCRGRTTLVIAHRLATVRQADRIAVLDEGRLVAVGRHEDLMASEGRYAELFRAQLGEAGGGA